MLKDIKNTLIVALTWFKLGAKALTRAKAGKEVPVNKIRAFEKELYPWMEANYSEVLEGIRTTGQLSAEHEAALKSAIEARVAEFLANL